jgi:UDP-glucose 4-epimerase
MARVLESVKNNTQFVCNGNSFETPDGTCVRDYVHVDDIARAHILALSSAGVPSGVYNLGTSLGASNLEVVAAAEKATSQSINVEFGPARTGDPDILTADAGKFTNTTGWTPVYTLDDMACHAWAWYSK